jgi:hypothetical protein
MNYNHITDHIKQILSLEAKVETEIENMLSDFENNYYFEIDIRTGNHPDQKIIWLSFYLPVINSSSVKEIIELGFTVHLDLRESDKMNSLEFNEKKAKLNPQQAFLMFVGKDLAQFSGLAKVGNISKEDIETHLSRCYLSIKQPVDTCNFTDFISQVKDDYIMPFFKNTKFSKYTEMVKPDTTETIQKMNEILTPVLESLNTKTLVSPEINRLFFQDIINALEGHENAAYFKKLNSQFPIKPDSVKIKI